MPIVPGLRGKVSRPNKIKYTGLDIEGNKIETIAEGFDARVVQHECDHLFGILYPQRMDDLSSLQFVSEARHWKEMDSESLKYNKKRKKILKVTRYDIANHGFNKKMLNIAAKIVII